MNDSRGFTLIELLVTLFIGTLLMSVVLYNFETFNDNLALSSAGQEMAIAIRQAQLYGVNVKESVSGGGDFNSGYGIYFNPSSNPSEYYIFADTNADQKYDEGDGCGGAITECIEKVTLRNGVTISEVCDATLCPPSPAVRSLHITFLRPNPDARINFANNGRNFVVGPSLTGRIRLLSLKNKILEVIIENTGQILTN